MMYGMEKNETHAHRTCQTPELNIGKIIRQAAKYITDYIYRQIYIR